MAHFDERSLSTLLQQRSHHHMLRARVLIFAVDKRDWMASSYHKKPIEIDEEELLRQVEEIDWTMAVNIEEDYQCFTEVALVRKKRLACPISMSGFEDHQSNAGTDAESCEKG